MSRYIDDDDCFERIRRDDGTLGEVDIGRGSASMRYNHLSQVGVLRLADALLTNTRLRFLQLMSNEIGDEGARALASALVHHPAMKSVRLGWNNIGDAGAVAIAEQMRATRTVTFWGLERNNIGQVGGLAIANALARNNSLWGLDISDNRMDRRTVEAFATTGLARNTVLQQLFIHGNVSPAGVSNSGVERELDYRESFVSIGETYIRVLKTSNKTLRSLGLFLITPIGAFKVLSQDQQQRKQQIEKNENEQN